MALVLYATVSGDAEIARRFMTAGERMRAEVRSALGILGEEIASRAEALAPVRTGKLRGSIRSRTFESTSDGRVGVSIRPGRAGWYGIFAEATQKTRSVDVKPYTRRAQAGTVHAVSEKTGRTLKRLSAQGVVFVRGAKGRRVTLRSRPFMRPALISVRDRIDAVIAEAVKRATEPTG